MMKKILYLLLALSLGLNTGLLVATLMKPAPPLPPQGQFPPGDGPGQPPDRRDGPQRDPAHLVDGHLAGMTQHLELGPEQQRQLRAILERSAPELMGLQREVEISGRRITEAYAAPDFDLEEFLRLVRETSVARTALDSLSAALLVEEAAILTVEQRIKYAEVAPQVHSNPQQTPRPKNQERPRDPERRPPPRR
jgi:Spy/CpxP family protein refolding chaperone